MIAFLSVGWLPILRTPSLELEIEKVHQVHLHRAPSTPIGLRNERKKKGAFDGSRCSLLVGC